MHSYIVWSGGCDSTALLHYWSRFASEEKPICAISINSNVLDGNKNHIEKKVRQKLIKRFANLPVRFMSVTVDFEAPKQVWNATTASGNHQASLWVSIVTQFLSANSTLAFGYVAGDCFWDCKLRVENILTEYSKICGVSLDIQYPFSSVRKAQVIKYLKEKNLYDLTWYCENPKTKKQDPCGKCRPCITHDLALYELENHEVNSLEVGS